MLVAFERIGDSNLSEVYQRLSVNRLATCGYGNYFTVGVWLKAFVVRGLYQPQFEPSAGETVRINATDRGIGVDGFVQSEPVFRLKP